MVAGANALGSNLGRYPYPEYYLAECNIGLEESAQGGAPHVATLAPNLFGRIGAADSARWFLPAKGPDPSQFCQMDRAGSWRLFRLALCAGRRSRPCRASGAQGNRPGNCRRDFALFRAA